MYVCDSLKLSVGSALARAATCMFVTARSCLMIVRLADYIAYVCLLLLLFVVQLVVVVINQVSS
jgi:hypothetical protein